MSSTLHTLNSLYTVSWLLILTTQNHNLFHYKCSADNSYYSFLTSSPTHTHDLWFLSVLVNQKSYRKFFKNLCSTLKKKNKNNKKYVQIVTLIREAWESLDY